MAAGTEDKSANIDVLTQIIDLLESIPPVPNWLQWFLILSGAVAPIVLFIWRQKGADWLANFSTAYATFRADRLLSNAVDAHRVCNNPVLLASRASGLVACVVLSMSGLIVAVVFYAINTTATYIFLASSYLVTFLYLVRVSAMKRARYPHEYEANAKKRAEDLLQNAGLPKREVRRRLAEFEQRIAKAKINPRIAPD